MTLKCHLVQWVFWCLCELDKLKLLQMDQDKPNDVDQKSEEDSDKPVEAVDETGPSSTETEPAIDKTDPSSTETEQTIDKTGHENADKEDDKENDIPIEATKDNTTKDNHLNLRTIFCRPKHAEPRHPILSSPYCRHIGLSAFGARKPKWYTSLSTSQFYLFQDLVNMVELGRLGSFKLKEFVAMFRDLDPSVTVEEVVRVLSSMRRSEFQELDFGKFLFLLAYQEHVSGHLNQDVVENEIWSKRPLTPRQALILSAIAYYVLITSPEDIERYYFSFTRPHHSVLWSHMESARLQGLTERQMEEKQLKARKKLAPLFLATGSPYALPVPFVPRFTKTRTFRDFVKKRPTVMHTALPLLKKEYPRPLKPIPVKRDMGDKVVFRDEDEELMAGITYGHFKLPDMTIPLRKLKEMRYRCTVKNRDYIIERAEKAMQTYHNRVKRAMVLAGQDHLNKELATGFHSKHDMEQYVEVHDRYMPRREEDVKQFSLWVPGVNRKTVFGPKFAFGTKIR